MCPFHIIAHSSSSVQQSSALTDGARVLQSFIKSLFFFPSLHLLNLNLSTHTQQRLLSCCRLDLLAKSFFVKVILDFLFGFSQNIIRTAIKNQIPLHQRKLATSSCLKASTPLFIYMDGCHHHSGEFGGLPRYFDC